MNARKRNVIGILATGVAATILLCTGLFWARLYCEVQRNDLPGLVREVSVSPGRQGSPEGGEDANLPVPPIVTAKTPGGFLYHSELGAVRYGRMFAYGEPDVRLDSNVYQWNPGPDGGVLRYDPSLGLFVYERSEQVHPADGAPDFRSIVRYAGPEGTAVQPNERLGRFIAPIADTTMMRPQVVYDRGMRRFFAIDWEANGPGVRKGPELPAESHWRPVQIGTIWKNGIGASIMPRAPREQDLWRPHNPDMDKIFVLDASGQIVRLDLQTLEIVGVAGRLPTPTPPLGSLRSARPEDVAGYTIQAFETSDGDTSNPWSYGGLAVASLSRDGFAMQLNYFDPNGRLLASNETRVRDYPWQNDFEGMTLGRPMATARAAYFLLPGARMLTWTKFLLESLHPPVLVLASYFAGPHFEATAGYRSVFLLPDSFVAMTARSLETERWLLFLQAIAYMMPGLVLFGAIATKVNRDGLRIGTPKNTRGAWVAAIMVFGLPAYIAYRLTRPKVTLVTCQNCGLGRRPDREKCHRCGSAWAVPELIPPAWRVLGEPEQAEESSASRAEETGSPA